LVFSENTSDRSRMIASEKAYAARLLRASGAPGHKKRMAFDTTENRDSPIRVEP
jgi:hypothetical protein